MSVIPGFLKHGALKVTSVAGGIAYIDFKV